MQPEKTNKPTKPSPKKTATKKAAPSIKDETAGVIMPSPIVVPTKSPVAVTAKKATPKAEKAAAQKNAVPKKESAPKKAPSKAKAVKTAQASLTFQINYGTKFGQVIKICGEHPALGNGSDDKAIALSFEDNNHWTGQINVPAGATAPASILYYYLIENQDGSVDKSAAYHLNIPQSFKALYIRDAWNSPAFIENAFSTDVFKVLQKQPTKAATSKSKFKISSHQFRVKAPALAEGQVICLTGSHDKLGKWDAQNVILLTPDLQFREWTTIVDLADLQEPIAYKYGIYDVANGTFLSFEQGENRIVIPLPAENKGCQVQLQDGFVRTN